MRWGKCDLWITQRKTLVSLVSVMSCNHANTNKYTSTAQLQSNKRKNGLSSIIAFEQKPEPIPTR